MHNFYHGVVTKSQEILLRVSLKFLSIFVHISVSIELITLIWYHWKDILLLEKFNIGDPQFWSKFVKSEVEHHGWLWAVQESMV